MRLRKLAFVLAFLTAVVGGTGIGLAQGPPTEDPSCRAGDNAPVAPGGEDCPGDKGQGEVPDDVQNYGTCLAESIIEVDGPGDCTGELPN